jgi:SAM-dependent methyltransferase
LLLKHGVAAETQRRLNFNIDKFKIKYILLYMHPTAMLTCQKFYNKYCQHLSESSSIIDFGSLNVNGSLKYIFNKHKYIGIDFSPGPNVDVVCKNEKVPFGNDSFDVAVSSSCFEHDDFFWLTFLEMCRLVKSGGYIYISSPSNGPYRAHPTDNWRFYLDSWKALHKWAIRNGYKIELVEHYINKENIDTDPNLWEDSIGIFKKI